jgi:U6 snRNA phosphodiesterase
MKRISLVTYSSSEDEHTQRPTPKRRFIWIVSYNHSILTRFLYLRKLPSLPPSLALQHVDDPALHQGRIRTMPHVDGQFAAHIYVSLPLEPRSRIQQLVGDVLVCAMETVPTLHTSLYNAGVNNEVHMNILEGELHISLSRPTYLHAHQREDLKRAVKSGTKRCSPCVCLFDRVILNARSRLGQLSGVLCNLLRDDERRTHADISHYGSRRGT